MNRDQQRAANKELREKFARTKADRAEMIRLLLRLAETDPTVSGATILLSDGTHEYVNADILRQGGRA